MLSMTMARRRQCLSYTCSNVSQKRNRANREQVKPMKRKYPVFSVMSNQPELATALGLTDSQMIFKIMEAAAESRQPRKIFFVVSEIVFSVCCC